MIGKTWGTMRTTHGACGVETRRDGDGADADGRRAMALVVEYEMDETRGVRVGGARAYALERRRGEGHEGSGGEVTVTELGRCGSETGTMDGIGAIFEARWSPRSGDFERCAFAGADGYVTVARVRETESGDGVEFSELGRVHVGGEGLGMATCLDWRADGAMCASAADGSFRVMREDCSAIQVVETIENAHDLEMWAVAFDLSRQDVVYTGADDCALKVWDLRDVSRPQMVNRKTHGAGVTCVAPSPRDEHVVATGSYDDHVRLWDVRRIASPVSELNVGGGAWRCRWHPRRDALACAAMGGGAALVDAKSNELELCFTYSEHESIVYGADWVCFGDDSEALLTCSFYDKTVKCWTLENVDKD